MIAFKFVSTFSLLILMTTSLNAQQPLAPRLLWPEDHPANAEVTPPTTDTPEWMTRVWNRPNLTAFLPTADKANGVAVLVLPGGGYGGVSMGAEGVAVAAWFQERGVAAFVLQYRCGGGANRQPAPLDDAQRAMQMIAAEQELWKIDAQKIGVIGFSAGGHLASCVSTMTVSGNPESDDPLERHSTRPAFAVLVYPVISMREMTTHASSRNNLLGEEPDESLIEHWSTHLRVDADTPATMLIHASDDRTVLPKHSILYYEALLKHKVPAAMHVYARGGHGFGLRPGNRSFRHWPELVERWMTDRGLLPRAPSP